jgi:hypothetical protein
MWIAYRRPQLQDLFLQVMEPTTEALRAMGMFEMRLVDEEFPATTGSNISGGHPSVSSSESQAETQRRRA